MYVGNLDPSFHIGLGFLVSFLLGYSSINKRTLVRGFGVRLRERERESFEGL